MEVEWVTIQDFPDYLISSEGDVLNKNSGRWMSITKNSRGVLRVGLCRGQSQHTRSVKVLVAEHFVDGKDEVFDTPIHLDGNEANCAAWNLTWRPRWFAWRYTHQFENIGPKDRIGPIREVDTRETYFDLIECAKMNGLLIQDIRESLVMKQSVFPTFQTFEMM